MKLYIILTIILTLGAALSPFVAIKTAKNEPDFSVSSVESESETEDISQDEATETVKILKTSSGKIVEKSVLDYVKGAVAGEISPEYEEEAIKAQAVVCYTYLLWLKENADNANLNGADVSDDPDTHQNYIETDELKEKWGDNYDYYKNKIEACVNEVAGKYLAYDGKPIMACYHAISTGRTESAKNVWGESIPYLKSVTANGDLLSPDIDSKVTFSEKEFRQCAEKLDGVKLQKKSKNWVGKIETAKSGFVSSVVIGKKAFNGNEIRKAFSLRSPAFTIEKTESGFVFHVKGYGHLVGMSQYSADYMARQGSSYETILKHFYKGAEIV